MMGPSNAWTCEDAMAHGCGGLATLSEDEAVAAIHAMRGLFLHETPSDLGQASAICPSLPSSRQPQWGSNPDSSPEAAGSGSLAG